MFWKHPTASASVSETQYKVQSDVLNLHTDLLSARCIVDRLRNVVGPAFVAESVDRKILREIQSDLRVVTAFLDSVESLLGPPAPVRTKDTARQQ